MAGKGSRMSSRRFREQLSTRFRRLTTLLILGVRGTLPCLLEPTLTPPELKTLRRKASSQPLSSATSAGSPMPRLPPCASSTAKPLVRRQAPLCSLAQTDATSSRAQPVDHHDGDMSGRRTSCESPARSLESICMKGRGRSSRGILCRKTVRNGRFVCRGKRGIKSVTRGGDARGMGNCSCEGYGERKGERKACVRDREDGSRSHELSERLLEVWSRRRFELRRCLEVEVLRSSERDRRAADLAGEKRQREGA